MPESHPLTPLNGGAAAPMIQVTGEQEPVRPAAAGTHRAAFVLGDDEEGDLGSRGSRRSSRRSIPKSLLPNPEVIVPGPKTTAIENGVGGKPAPLDPAPSAPKRPASAPVRAFDALMSNSYMAWIKPKLNFASLKVVIRVSVSMWIGFVFLIIHPVGFEMGPAAFLVLITSALIPPWQSFVQVVEVVFNLLIYSCVSWAWICIACVIAHATRHPTDPAKIASAEALFAHIENESLRELKIIIHATFLQAKPAVVSAIFLAVGTGIALWWKLLTTPSAATMPLVIACIIMDVGLTLVPMYPYPFYKIGWIPIQPIFIQGGIGLLCALVIFPQSASHQFRTKFAGVVDPLHRAVKQMEVLFAEASHMDTFGVHDKPEASKEGDKPEPSKEGYARNVSFDAGTGERLRRDSETDHKLKEWGDRSAAIRQVLLGSLAGIPPLGAQMRYLPIDISFGRLSGKDLQEIYPLLAAMQARASGLSFFFNAIVNNVRHTHMDSAGFSAKGVLEQHDISRPPSRAPSRPGSVRNIPSLRDLLDHSDHDTGSHTPRAARGSGRDTPPHDTDDDSQRDGAHPEKDDHAFMKRLHKHLKHGGRHGRSRSPGRHGHGHGHKGSHMSLLEHLHKAQQPVGVYESQRYMDVERVEDQELDRVLEGMELLSKGSLPMAKALVAGLGAGSAWVHTSDRKRPAGAEALKEAATELEAALKQYKMLRPEVIKPFAHLFDPSHINAAEEKTTVHHKGLFYCFVAQYHIIEFGDALHSFLVKIIEKDEQRPKRRLWLPSPLALLAVFGIDWYKPKTKKDLTTDPDDEGGERFDGDDEDDDETERDQLGEARRRNPDYMPWTTTPLILLSKLTQLSDALTSRSGMFFIKACVLSALTSMPAFFHSTAAWYYDNRGIWATIMAQLTLAVFSGETFGSWVSRLLASFFGGCIGLAMWYTGSGHGPGNPYGLAAVCAVVFPFVAFYRVYYPAPVTSIVFVASVVLVVGECHWQCHHFLPLLTEQDTCVLLRVRKASLLTSKQSYSNGHLYKLTNASWGWEVGWLRFTCVVIGITAAWFFSYLPPSYSARFATRQSHARSIGAAGRILCDILSAANDPHPYVNEAQNEATRNEIQRARAKLSKLKHHHHHAMQEYTIRGRWPEQSYAGLLNTLEELMSLLAQFNHVLPQMDPHWRRSLLIRTRMADPLFLGDVLAVISMTLSALRAGTPLPQITPGPLIVKYHMSKHKGFSVPHDPGQHHDDIPNHVTTDVLQGEQYMRYALGVATVYAIMSRLDGLVAVCKTLLGENFHISNLRFGDIV
ncbi:hypothetical protein Q8F55_004164 [Vanrija albida]|uniref:ER transporter 6TM N-terminal domain-containing protein n=1 Tax=Vanrija albida TaxID=181172 RepID=A0ABR3Q5Z6_9TREE